MEVNKVKGGWSYDGIIFKKKADAFAAKEANEKDDSLPSFLKGNKPRSYMIYDSDQPTSFGLFVSDYITQGKGKRTIQGLSDEIGVSKQTFFKWINGESFPSEKHVAQIKKVMKCSDKVLVAALMTNCQFLLARTTGITVSKVKRIQKELIAVGQ